MCCKLAPGQGRSGHAAISSCHLGKMMDAIKKGMTPNEAYEKNVGTYGRFKAEDGAVK